MLCAIGCNSFLFLFLFRVFLFWFPLYRRPNTKMPGTNREAGLPGRPRSPLHRSGKGMIPDRHSNATWAMSGRMGGTPADGFPCLGATGPLRSTGQHVGGRVFRSPWSLPYGVESAFPPSSSLSEMTPISSGRVGVLVSPLFPPGQTRSRHREKCCRIFNAGKILQMAIRFATACSCLRLKEY